MDDLRPASYPRVVWEATTTPMPQRDDFNEPIKRALAARVATLCSNPDCRALTSGPHEDAGKAVNLGVAAHITAAAAGGPRYDAGLTAEQRSSAENAIWLCQNCAKLIDNDPVRFPVAVLRAWKVKAEETARSGMGKAPVAPMPTGPTSYEQNLHGVIAGAVVSGPGSSGTGIVNIYAQNFYAGAPSASPPQAAPPSTVDTRQVVEQPAPSTTAALVRSVSRPLVVLGPQIVAEGGRVAVAGNVWTLHLHRFVMGDETALGTVADANVPCLLGDRCVILSDPGEARAIAGNVICRMRGEYIEVEVPVCPPGAKESVMLRNDVDPETGRAARGVPIGVAVVRNWMCVPVGHFSDGNFGSWMPIWLQASDLQQRLRDLIRMDLLRLMSVPRVGLHGESRVPLAFVERVIRVAPHPDEGDGKTFPAEVEMTFVGGGPWKGEILVARAPADPEAHKRIMKNAMAGASGV